MYFSSTNIAPIGCSFTGESLRIAHKEIMYYDDLYSDGTKILEANHITYIKDLNKYEDTTTLEDAKGLVWINTIYKINPDESTETNHVIHYYIITNKEWIKNDITINIIEFVLSDLTLNVPNVKAPLQELVRNNKLINEQRILHYLDNM